MSAMRRHERKEKDPSLGVLAAKVLFNFEREMFAELAAQGHPDVRPRHGAVLAYLDAEGTRAKDLARLSGRHKQVITTLVDELSELGYVERRQDPDDGRAKLIVPTTSGLDVMKRTDSISRAIERRHARLVGKETLAQVKASMREIGAGPRA